MRNDDDDDDSNGRKKYSLHYLELELLYEF